jgi:hypothetical protein
VIGRVVAWVLGPYRRRRAAAAAARLRELERSRRIRDAVNERQRTLAARLDAEARFRGQVAEGE